MPQSHVCVLWLPEVGMMLPPKRYVPLRTKMLEMNLESLELMMLKSTGYGPSATGRKDRAWGKGLRKKSGEHSAARGGSCVLERGCCMPTSSARAGGAPLVKVCGDGPRTQHFIYRRTCL